MESGVYLILSPTHKPYIGESKNIHKRWIQYKSNLAKGQIKLNRSFLKHGFENHNFLVLEYCEHELLHERERYYQDLYSSMNYGLNCKLTPTKSKKVVYSEETKYKMGTSFRGKKLTDEHKNKISIANKNRIVRDSTRKIMSNIFKGTRMGFENFNHIKIKVVNTITKEENIYTQTDVIRKLGMNYVTVKRRCSYYNNGKEKTMQDFEFYFLDSPIKKLNLNYRKILLDTQTGVYYYSFLDLANELNKTDCIIRTMLKNNKRYILTED